MKPTCRAVLLQVLAAMVHQTAEHLYVMMTDRFGSHAVRKLLCVLAGWDVSPPRKAAATASKVWAFLCSSDFRGHYLWGSRQQQPECSPIASKAQRAMKMHMQMQMQYMRLQHSVPVAACLHAHAPRPSYEP